MTIPMRSVTKWFQLGRMYFSNDGDDYNCLLSAHEFSSLIKKCLIMLEFFVQVSYFENNALLYFQKKKQRFRRVSKITVPAIPDSSATRTLQKHAVFYDEFLKWMYTDSELPADCLAFKEILNRKQLYFSVKDTKKLSSKVLS